MPKQKTICRRLFVALLLLFIMQVLLLPAVISATYATKSVKPEHIITYTPGKLSWDENTETDSSGACAIPFIVYMPYLASLFAVPFAIFQKSVIGVCSQSVSLKDSSVSSPI